MNCADVRARLALLPYGELTPAEADEVRQHVTRCPACEKEQADLAQLRDLLDAAPAPAVTVDLPRLFRDAARGQVRRWRGVAVAALAAAAAVVVGLLLARLEVRLERNQLVLRWGAVPTLPDQTPAPVPPREEPAPAPLPVASAAEIEQQLRLLRELVQAVSNDADLRDERRQREIAQLRGRLHGLEQQMTQLRLSTERDVSALYTAQSPDKSKGASQ
jgi:anti-sigma factor RsiW